MEKPVQVDSDRVLIEYSDESPTTRRELLATLGVGGGAMLAGCGGNGSDTPTPGDDGSTPADDSDVVEGQTLYLPIQTQPSEHTFINTGAFPNPATMGDGWEVGTQIIEATHEPGHWGRWMAEPKRSGERFGGLFDTVEITPDEITVQVKDDAVWSNGDDVLGRDVISEFAAFRLFFNLKSFDEATERGPDLAAEAVTDVEYDGKTATFRSDGGWFGEMIKEDIWMYLLTRWEWGGVNYNSQIAPFDDLFDTIMGLFRDAQSGEANPWDLDEGPHMHVIMNEPFEHEDGNHWPEFYRDPANVVTSGAWTLEEFRGDDRIVLTKNEHHRHADEINFEEVVLKWRPPEEGEQAHWAALNTNNLDYYGQITPDHVATSFGDDVARNLTPEQGGITFTLNHDAEIFSEPEYRRGLYYALDKTELAEIQNPDQFDPITTPGGDLWDADKWFDDGFVDQLNTYEHDPERAAAIWQDAGFTKEDGQWSLPSGDRAELVVPTDNQSPEVEIAFVSQLKDFGIAAEILTLDSATFAEREAAGEFDVYPTPPSTVPGANVGYVLYGVARTWAVTAQRGSRMCGQLNWYPGEQCEKVEYSDGDGIIAEATAEGFSPFTLEAPPVGEWDGPLQEWEAPRMGWEAWRSPDPEQIQELYPQLAWLVNWWMPNLPIANGLSQQLYQVTHWDWPPEDDVAWEAIGGHRMAGLGGKVAANPDNPRRD
jgi:ABC-type transport system substrate-binding protein